MRKPRRYPTLLELMRRGRQAALASGSALAMLTAGCPAPEAEQDPLFPGAVDLQTFPDAQAGDDGTPGDDGQQASEVPDVNFPMDLGGIAPMPDVLPEAGPTDEGQDLDTETIDAVRPVDTGVPSETEVGEAEEPLAGDPPMPDPA